MISVILDCELTMWKSKIRQDGLSQFYVHDIDDESDEQLFFNVNYTEIIEVSALKLDENLNIVDRFHTYVKPQNPITKACTKLTNVTNENVKDAPVFEDVLSNLIKWIGKEEFTLYTFDMNDKNNFYNQQKFTYGSAEKVDILFKNHLKIRSLFKDAMYKQLGIRTEKWLGIARILYCLGLNRTQKVTTLADKCLDNYLILRHVTNNKLGDKIKKKIEKTIASIG